MNRDRDVFRRTVLRYWRRHGRHDLPWRTKRDPYRVLVSEVMLQQTQVARVISKYQAFLKQFPTVVALARAPRQAVLAAWQGLGYNRRALALQACAQAVVKLHQSRFPDNREALQALPGIGPYTAGAVLVFAYDRPEPLIETNVRRVYLHHFFPRQKGVTDDRLLPFVAKDAQRSRSPYQWFSALMDYGSWLATQVPNPNTRSRQYSRQSTFQGSQRQLRGKVLRMVLRDTAVPYHRLVREIGEDERLSAVLRRLESEGFLHWRGKTISIQ